MHQQSWAMFLRSNGLTMSRAGGFRGGPVASVAPGRMVALMTEREFDARQ